MERERSIKIKQQSGILGILVLKFNIFSILDLENIDGKKKSRLSQHGWYPPYF